MKKKTLLLLAIGVSISPVIFASAGVGEHGGIGDFKAPSSLCGFMGGSAGVKVLPQSESMVKGPAGSPDDSIPSSSAFNGGGMRAPSNQQAGTIGGQMTVPQQAPNTMPPAPTRSATFTPIGG